MNNAIKNPVPAATDRVDQIPEKRIEKMALSSIAPTTDNSNALTPELVQAGGQISVSTAYIDWLGRNLVTIDLATGRRIYLERHVALDLAASLNEVALMDGVNA